MKTIPETERCQGSYWAEDGSGWRSMRCKQRATHTNGDGSPRRDGYHSFCCLEHASVWLGGRMGKLRESFRPIQSGDLGA